MLKVTYKNSERSLCQAKQPCTQSMIKTIPYNSTALANFIKLANTPSSPPAPWYHHILSLCSGYRLATYFRRIMKRK